MKKVLVTGAGGFVGKRLAEHLYSLGCEVIALGRSQRPPELSEKIAYVRWDLTAPDFPKELLQGVDTAFHLAWDGVSGPRRADLKIQMENALAAAELARLCCSCGVKRFVGLGTIMEQEAEGVLNAEESRPGPGYIYGEAKHFAHMATKILAASAGMDHVWVKITNTYGPGEDSLRLINTTMKKILAGEPLEFSAGTQLYDFIYIDDAVRAIALAGEKGRAFCSYVVGSGSPAPLRSYLERLGACLAPQEPLCFGRVPFTGVSLTQEQLDSSALTRDTGFVPEVSFEEGLCKTMEYVREKWTM